MSRLHTLLTAGATALVLSGCVQPAYDRTVIYELDVSALDDVKTAGLRGDNEPLSWQKDSPMTVVVPDSLYRATVTYHTGYLKTEMKFTVNGNFEFDNADNRRVEFSTTGDTTIYRARYNTRP